MSLYFGRSSQIVATQLVERFNLSSFVKNQHRLRPNLITSTALTFLTDKIYDNIDKKRIALLTLCDLSKTLDSVSHSTLVEKKENTPIDKFCFDDHQSEMFQSIRLRDTASSKNVVLHDVSQGSIIAPIIFTIYVNDMSAHFTTCARVKYADDTQYLHMETWNGLKDLIYDAEHTLQ